MWEIRLAVTPGVLGRKVPRHFLKMALMISLIIIHIGLAAAGPLIGENENGVSGRATVKRGISLPVAPACRDEVNAEPTPKYSTTTPSYVNEFQTEDTFASSDVDEYHSETPPTTVPLLGKWAVGSLLRKRDATLPDGEEIQNASQFAENGVSEGNPYITHPTINVLKTTVDETTNVCCSSDDKLQARGEYVKLSEVLRYKCDNLKFIEIFAYNTVLIDLDLVRVGDELQVAILAPRWEAIGERKIVLHGVQGPRHENQGAGKETLPGGKGLDGNSGLPGINAGNYFGISREFVRGDVTIEANGGRGGPGQDGGDGIDGMRGDVPQLPCYRTNCNISAGQVKFTYKRTLKTSANCDCKDSCVNDVYKYELYVRNGGNGGDGGHGGRGGRGGRGGYMKHIVLHDRERSWESVGQNGDEGARGMGGKGGRAGRDGDILEVKCESHSFASSFRWKETGRRLGEVWSQGRDGVEGGSSRGMIEAPEADACKGPLPTIINRYKQFLMSVDCPVKGEYFKQFIQFLESDPNVKALRNNMFLKCLT